MDILGYSNPMLQARKAGTQRGVLLECLKIQWGDRNTASKTGPDSRRHRPAPLAAAVT